MFERERQYVLERDNMCERDTLSVRERERKYVGER
jgi:hypothetical protein